MGRDKKNEGAGRKLKRAFSAVFNKEREFQAYYAPMLMTMWMPFFSIGFETGYETAPPPQAAESAGAARTLQDLQKNIIDLAAKEQVAAKADPSTKQGFAAKQDYLASVVSFRNELFLNPAISEDAAADLASGLSEALEEVVPVPSFRNDLAFRDEALRSFNATALSALPRDKQAELVMQSAADMDSSDDTKSLLTSMGIFWGGAAGLFALNTLGASVRRRLEREEYEEREARRRKEWEMDRERTRALERQLQEELASALPSPAPTVRKQGGFKL